MNNYQKCKFLQQHKRFHKIHSLMYLYSYLHKHQSNMFHQQHKRFRKFRNLIHPFVRLCKHRCYLLLAQLFRNMFRFQNK